MITVVGLSFRTQVMLNTSNSIINIIDCTFPMGISLVPSSMKILAMYPSSVASKPMVALSVSMSASKSPSDTLSPTFFCHLLIVPVSMVGERAGRTTFIWLGKPTNQTNIPIYISLGIFYGIHKRNPNKIFPQHKSCIEQKNLLNLTFSFTCVIWDNCSVKPKILRL